MQFAMNRKSFDLWGIITLWYLVWYICYGSLFCSSVTLVIGVKTAEQIEPISG